MAKLNLVPCTRGALRHIAHYLRQADVDELSATREGAFNEYAVLLESTAISEVIHIAETPYGEPIAVFGLAPIHWAENTGCPWMLGTDKLQDYPRDVITLGKQFAIEWGKKYSMLTNCVDARNTKSIAWLKHSGYEVLPAMPYGPKGMLFHPFQRCT